MFVANARDLRFTPTGILSQKRIASPKMRYFTPRARRCAANESPYGPAPIIATSVAGFITKNLSSTLAVLGHILSHTALRTREDAANCAVETRQSLRRRVAR